jgi:diguanylate cyclase (GGDEF)-like protein
MGNAARPAHEFSQTPRLQQSASQSQLLRHNLPRSTKPFAEQMVSGMQSSPPRVRERSKPTGWDRTRLGVLVPLGVVVAVAIVCIVVAALTSAQRADDVALERERQLLTRAIDNHAEWLMLRLRNTVKSSASVSAEDINQSPAVVQPRLRSWLGSLIDHDLVLVVDSAGAIVYSQPGQNSSDPELSMAAVSRAHAIVEFMRGRTARMPAGAMRLLGGAPSMRHHGVAETVFLINIRDRLNLVSAIPIGETSAAPSPFLLTVRTVDQTMLAHIGERLQLADLRMVGREPEPEGHNAYEFVDGNNDRIVRFAWIPLKPGAAILISVIPFIGIALAGFTILAGLVLRYMRYTAATIAAGENRLRDLALHDPLCGLPNRNFFGDRLESTIADVQRAVLPAAAVFYIDLDHFKDVNDTLGHPIGDELIRNVTLRLSRMMRGDDLVARLGGDEFAVITAASADHATLHEIASRMIATLCAPYSISGHTIVIGASIGIAVIDRRTGGSADIMRYADMALYRAKNEGRNRACIYDAVMDADLSQRKLIEQNLRETIANDALGVLYQPIFNASGDKVVGVEALARWRHPTRGFIPPTEFIPIAEHSGLIIELGTQVLRRACLDGLAWPGITVSVNVSPLQFRRLDFVNVVERILAETGFDPKRLELELTETTLLGNVESAEAAMLHLKALGVCFALDDFGTGYSSLLYLRRFPFDKLKVDRSFVHSIEKAADAAAIVHAVVSLGRGLGMKVTAEGVETAEQHLFLRAAGVHYMQGFRFGRPAEPADIEVRIATPGIYRSLAGDANAALAG